VAREARRLGLFLLRDRGTLEFLSSTTGRRVLLWVESTGVLLDAASNRVGFTRSPLEALARAAELDRAAQGAVPSHQRAADGPRRAGPPHGPPGRPGRG
jgi:hypothetical protein